MNYQDINAQTIDRWVEEGWEWGIPIDHETYEKAKNGQWDVVLTPTAQFTTATFPSGCPGHSWQIVSAGRTSLSHKGVIYAAKVLAGSVADLMENQDLVKQARDEFRITAAEGYDCPISKDLIPTVG